VLFPKDKQEEDIPTVKIDKRTPNFDFIKPIIQTSNPTETDIVGAIFDTLKTIERMPPTLPEQFLIGVSVEGSNNFYFADDFRTKIPLDKLKEAKIEVADAHWIPHKLHDMPKDLEIFHDVIFLNNVNSLENDAV